jgi:RNA polymerase sigma factor (TIGR02999 family)
MTALLASARRGDKESAAEVFALMYEELRRIARARLSQHQDFTLLDTTALVHESYLKLAGLPTLPVEDRKHFFTYAATVMRSVIVDFARARATERRGALADKVMLDTALADQLAQPDDDVLRVHEALEVLEQADAQLAKIVEMRYFGGLTEVEIAQVLELSDRTVRRNWEKAKLILSAALSSN